MIYACGVKLKGIKAWSLKGLRLLRAVSKHHQPLSYLRYRLLLQYPAVFAAHCLSVGSYKLTLEPSQIIATILDKDRTYFQREEKILVQLMSKGGLFIDVGSNIGHLSLAVASSVPSSQIIAIEANPRSFQILQRNIIINNAPIEAHNLAIGDQDRRKTMITCSHLDACNSVHDTAYLDQEQNEEVLYLVDKGKPVHVQMRTLDSMANQYSWKSHPRCIKIDIEGFELFALRGGQKLIKNTQYVYFEYWDKLSLKYGYSLDKIREFFSALDFELYYLPDDAPIHDVFREKQRLCNSVSLEKNTNIIAVNNSYACN